MNEAYPGAVVVDRIEAILQEMARDVNGASGAVRNSWIFFMALVAYYFIALAGVTDRDLLLSTPVKLPLLDVEIGLRAFFLFGPLILVLIHFSILMQHALLSRKLREFHEFAWRMEGQGRFRTNRVRVQLHSYFYTQLVAGPARGPLFAVFLSLMTWMTLVLLPIALLINFQISFLAYHDVMATWMHRLYLLSDLAIIAIFGIYMRYPGAPFVAAFGANIERRPLSFLVSALLCMTALFFSFSIATIPDETMDRMMTSFAATRTPVPVGEENTRGRAAFWPTAMLFEGAVDHISGRPTSLFGRNLVVTDSDIVQGDLRPGEVSVSLRRRDLRYATFDRSDLRQADITGALLTRASLRETDLIDIKAQKANLQDADLSRARFITDTPQERAVLGADLREADFRRASLRQTNLLGARLEGALLAGADLTDAQLDPEDAAEAASQGAPPK